MTATHRTPAEAKAEHVAKMGDELGRLYDELWQQMAWLYRKWDQYVTLFGTKPSRVELLNKAAPLCFRIVQDALWEDVLLHIARLTDSPQSVGKPNLSFRRLPAAVSHAQTKAKAEAALKTALTYSAFCRDWRNRHIAHRDLRLALDQGADPLMQASREKVRETLQSLVDLLNTVADHYLETTSIFDLGTEQGGAMQLLYVLDDGLRVHQARLDRLKAATAEPEDWKPRPL